MQSTVVDFDIQNDEALAALQNVSSGTASSADYAVVRSYLRTPEGRQQASQAIQQLDKAAVQRTAQTMIPESARVFDVLYTSHVEAMREELYATSTTTAERLIADEVVAAYIRLQFTQRKYDDAKDKDSLRFWDKQLTGAHRRYIRCLETLSRIRRYEVQLVERRDADGSQQRSVSIRANS